MMKDDNNQGLFQRRKGTERLTGWKNIEKEERRVEEERKINMKRERKRNSGAQLWKERVRGNKRGRQRIDNRKEKTICTASIYKYQGRTDKSGSWLRHEKGN